MMAICRLGSTIRLFSRQFCNVSRQIVNSRSSLKYLPLPFLKSVGRASPLLLSSFPVVQAFWGSKPVEDKTKMSEDILKQADELFDQNKNKETYELLLPHKDEQNIEILWRLSRIAYLYGKEVEDKEEQKRLYFQSFEFAEKCLEVDEKHFAGHKWYGILLDVVAGYTGTKKRIEDSFKVKEHFTRAIELNPSDATTIYSLGYWHYLFADMPWYQRKVAAVIFASPPTATYEDALEYFKKAEETSPNFFSKNLLMLGKCYSRLKDKEQAIAYLKRARDYEQKTVDDKEAHKEAVDELKSLGVKE